VSAACGGALERKIGGIERRHADLPVMMPAMSVRSYVGAVISLNGDNFGFDSNSDSAHVSVF
jgi:hypothetical protein